MRARDAGFEVIYQGIRLTPEQIVAAAVAEDVHCVGLSILSGSHMEAVPAVLDGMRAAGAGDVPVIVGGIIPDSDAAKLKEMGVAAVFTPKDFGLTEIMGGIVDVIRAANGLLCSLLRGEGCSTKKAPERLSRGIPRLSPTIVARASRQTNPAARVPRRPAFVASLSTSTAGSGGR